MAFMNAHRNAFSAITLENVLTDSTQIRIFDHYQKKRKPFLDASQAQVSFFNSVQVPSVVLLNDEVSIIHQFFLWIV
jgi:hypothetical protein